MFSIQYPWKSFKIHLPDLEAKMKSLAGACYKGNSAEAAHLTLWFDHEPSEQTKAQIEEHYNSLFETGENAKISKDQKRERAVEAAKVSIPLQNWDQLTAGERKIMMNMPLSEADKDELVSKYPQV